MHSVRVSVVEKSPIVFRGELADDQEIVQVVFVLFRVLHFFHVFFSVDRVGFRHEVWNDRVFDFL